MILTNASNIRYGGADVREVRLGGTSVWQRSTPPPLEEGLVFWLKAIDDLLDHSGYAHSVVPTKPTLLNNGQLELRGADDYLDIPEDLGYTTALTACGWFRAVGEPGSDHHIMFGGPEMEISIHTAGYLRAGIHDGATRVVADYGTGLVDGTYHHLAVTYDQEHLIHYIDAVEVGRTPLSQAQVVSAVPSRRIGRFGVSTEYFANADLYDLRVYSRALVVEDLQAIVTATRR